MDVGWRVASFIMLCYCLCVLIREKVWGLVNCYAYKYDKDEATMGPIRNSCAEPPTKVTSQLARGTTGRAM